MPKVFVSHASADKEFVDAFVDTILRIGLGLNGESIFYSSERDTGISSGKDAIATVRKQVGKATLVIAIITPTYQTRPICIAELGAAWGRSDTKRFFPLLAPGLERAQLDGVIPYALAGQIGDPATLDELSDRIETCMGPLASKTQWGVGKQKWLTRVATAAETLNDPDIPTVDGHRAVVQQLADVTKALEYTEQELDTWKAKFAELELSKDATEARRIRVGGDMQSRLEACVSVAQKALNAVPAPVHEAIYQSLRSGYAVAPSRFDDPDAADLFDDAIERKLLVEEDDGAYGPNTAKRRVSDAVDAVNELQTLVHPGRGADEAFIEWFLDEYDTEPDLADRDCWEALLS